jgi:hypothetical protein
MAVRRWTLTWASSPLADQNKGEFSKTSIHSFDSDLSIASGRVRKCRVCHWPSLAQCVGMDIGSSSYPSSHPPTPQQSHHQQQQKGAGPNKQNSFSALSVSSSSILTSDATTSSPYTPIPALLGPVQLRRSNDIISRRPNHIPQTHFPGNVPAYPVRYHNAR